jgi:integrase
LPEPHREMDYLRLEEIPVYLAACGRMYRPLAELLIATGLGISEALALRWDDVDLEGGRIRVLRALKKEGVGSTKGDRARAVDVGPRLDAVLRDLQGYQACFLPVGGSTPVFVRRDGTVPDRNSVSSGAHKATLRRAGLRETIRLHDLRHTAAATWLSAGLPLIYVQRQLGHASLSTTEAVYAHLEGGVFDGASEKAERAIWDKAGPRAA